MVCKLAGLAIAAPAITTQSIQAQSNYDLEREPPLRRQTRASGIRYGCASAAPNVQQDRLLLEKLAIEANIFAPDFALKWLQTEPQAGKFDFSQGDSVADFAARNDMLVHGHTLVWYAAIPAWVEQLSNAQDAREALERHISTQVPRYRGIIWAWDVVNEPIEPDDRLEGGHRNSVWYRCLGEDYIDLAFRIARGADDTPLCLSEYNLEYVTVASRRRRKALLALLRKLRKQKTPIDCLALQSHLIADQLFDRGELTEFLRNVVAMGYKLAITELDVNDFYVVGNASQRDRVRRTPRFRIS